MADASKRVEIVMRSWTAIAVYALLSATARLCCWWRRNRVGSRDREIRCKLEPNDAKTGCGSCNQSMWSQWLQSRVKGSSNDVWCAGDFGG
jgi:hypothetical protein